MGRGAMALCRFCLFVQIAGKINRTIKDVGLRELGQLEQDLVFGDAGMKDVIKYLTTKDVRNCRDIYGSTRLLTNKCIINGYHLSCRTPLVKISCAC